MIKKLHSSILASIMEKLLSSVELFSWGDRCLFLFGEPDIDIPEE